MHPGCEVGMVEHRHDVESASRSPVRLLSMADIIAQAMCEFDGRNWLELDPWQRGRYVRVATVAQERIKKAMLAGAIPPN